LLATPVLFRIDRSLCKTLNPVSQTKLASTTLRQLRWVRALPEGRTIFSLRFFCSSFSEENNFLFAGVQDLFASD